MKVIWKASLQIDDVQKISLPKGIEGKYIGTFQMQQGAIVFHVFETKE